MHTGQLEEVLSTSEIIQYKLRITHTLTIQNICIFNIEKKLKKLRKWFEKGFLYRRFEKAKQNSMKENEPDESLILMKLMNEIKSRIFSLPLKENQQQIRIEMLTKISELYEKFQTINENTLQQMKQNEIKTERQLNEMEKKLTYIINSHANDLMNKTN